MWWSDWSNVLIFSGYQSSQSDWEVRGLNLGFDTQEVKKELSGAIAVEGDIKAKRRGRGQSKKSRAQNWPFSGAPIS